MQTIFTIEVKAGEKHASEMEHMVTLNAVGYETGEYMGSAASESDEDDEADEGTISTEPQATAAQDEGGQDVQEVDDPLNDSLAVAELESSL